MQSRTSEDRLREVSRCMDEHRHIYANKLFFKKLRRYLAWTRDSLITGNVQSALRSTAESIQDLKCNSRGIQKEGVR